MYVSNRRDGSVWVRVGTQLKDHIWNQRYQQHNSLHDSVLTEDHIKIMSQLNYTKICVLTDLHLQMRSFSAWQPSYLIFHHLPSEEEWIVSMQHHEQCRSNAVVALKDHNFQCWHNKQLSNIHSSKHKTLSSFQNYFGFNFIDQHPRRLTCGQFKNTDSFASLKPSPTFLTTSSIQLFDNQKTKNFSILGNTKTTSISKRKTNDNSDTVNIPSKTNVVNNNFLLKTFSLVPNDNDAWKCTKNSRESDRKTFNENKYQENRPKNSFTLVGSYYHVYLKVAQCSPPLS